MKKTEKNLENAEEKKAPEKKKSKNAVKKETKENEEEQSEEKEETKKNKEEKKADGKEKKTGPNMNQEKLRLTTARADKTELETRIKRGEYIRAKAADEHFSTIFFTVRTKLLLFPKSVAKECAEEKTVLGVEKILEKAVRKILEELSKPSLEEISKEDDL